jgi:hypothetical protein
MGPARLRWFARCATAILILSLPTVAAAVEIGTDAGLSFASPDSAGTQIRFAFPSYDATQSPTRQFVRVGLPVGSAGTVELTPGVEVTSNPDYGGRITSTALAMGVSYLGGHSDGTGAAPYFRVGAHGKYFHTSAVEPRSAHSETQFGLSGGGGVRWRLGRVVGLREEVVATRWLGGLYPAYWDFSLRGGISAFTK